MTTDESVPARPQPEEPRVIVITGASRPGGIGRAIAERFVRNGDHVVISDIGRPLQSFPDYQVPHLDALAQAVAYLEGIGAGRAQSQVCDVTVSAEVDELVRRVVAEHGRLDVFVNNAGISLGLAPITELSDEAWARNVDVMATGTFYGIRAAARHMQDHGGGSIINISSQAGKTGWPLMGAYSAAKFAVIGLTQSAARELGPRGIRVNAICPGTVDTPLLDLPGGPMEIFARRSGVDRDTARRRQHRAIPLRRFASPHDIADTAFFLASAAASFITGEAVNVTGGEEMH